MENPCHRCNLEVAPGTPFCPHCNAPQIRVVTSGESQPIASDFGNEPLAPSRLEAGFLKPDPPRTNIHWASALPKTAASGFATVAMLVLVVSLTQVPALSLLVLPLGGMLSVVLYSRGNHGRITAGHGARLGAVTGFFAFIVYGLIVTAEMSARRGELLDMLRKTLQEAAARNPNPQAQEMVQQIMTPSGLGVLLALTAVIFFFAFLILSSLGGSVGASIVNSMREEE